MKSLRNFNLLLCAVLPVWLCSCSKKITGLDGTHYTRDGKEYVADTSLDSLRNGYDVWHYKEVKKYKSAYNSYSFTYHK